MVPVQPFFKLLINKVFYQRIYILTDVSQKNFMYATREVAGHEKKDNRTKSLTLPTLK